MMEEKNGDMGTQNPEKINPEEINLEELLLQVNHCISQLENPQISLEDSFRYYEEGIRKLKACNHKVAQIEKKMMIINSRGGLEDFYVNGDGTSDDTNED